MITGDSQGLWACKMKLSFQTGLTDVTASANEIVATQ